MLAQRAHVLQGDLKTAIQTEVQNTISNQQSKPHNNDMGRHGRYIFFEAY